MNENDIVKNMDIEVVKEMIREEMKRKRSAFILQEFYALERSDFRDKVGRKMPAIILHWAMIRYNRILGNDAREINHWKNEIAALIESLMRTEIKKNNSTKARLRAVQQEWDAQDLWNGKKWASVFRRKLIQDEKIDINCTEFQIALEQWSEEGKVVIDIIANMDTLGLDNFIDNL